MKINLRLLSILLFAGFNSLAQSNPVPKVDSSATTTPATAAVDFIPNNKLLLENLINETKSKLDQDNKSLQSYLNLSKQINDCKDKISKVQSKISADAIAPILAKKADDEWRQANNAYVTLYNSLAYYIISQNNPGYDEANDVKLQFGQSIQNELANSFSPIYNIFTTSEKNLTEVEKQSLKSFFTEANIDNIKKRITGICDTKQAEVSKSIDLLKSRIKSTNDYLPKLYEKFNEQETQINSLAIKLGLPLFCITILLLFLGPKLLRYLFKAPAETDNSSQNMLVEISTVLLLTMSILILGLSEKIKSDVLGTLIGGISGYVLNRMRSTNQSEKDKPAV
jgi:hypothetical protein